MLLETILCEFGRICATGNVPRQLETILCEFGQICATGNVGRNSILNFPAKIRRGMCKPFCVVTHHTAKANLEKGSSWPSETIQYGLPHTPSDPLAQTHPYPWGLVPLGFTKQ